MSKTGAELMALIKSKNITIGKAAALIGVDRTTVYNWSNQPEISDSTFNMVVEKLGISVSDNEDPPALKAARIEVASLKELNDALKKTIEAQEMVIESQKDKIQSLEKRLKGQSPKIV